MYTEIITRIKKQKLLFVKAEICILVTYACALILPLNLTLLIDRVVKDGEYHLITTLLVRYIIIFIVFLVTNFFYSGLWQTIYNRYVVSVKNDCFERLINAKAANLSNMNSGEMMDRIDYDCDQFIEAVLKNVFHFANSIILCVGILYIISTYNIFIALLVFFAAALPIIFSRISAYFVGKYTKEHRTVGGIFNGNLFEALKGMRELRLQNNTENKSEEINNSLKKLISLGNAIKRTDLTLDKCTYFANLSCSVLIYFLSVKMISQDNMTVGSFMVIISYLALLHKKLNWVVRLSIDWRARKVSINRVIDVLNLPQEDITGKEIEHLENIKFNDVSFGYNSSEVFTNLSFNINKGEKLAIVGVSGAGKTTILGLLLKLYLPNSGAIYINGLKLNEVNARSVRKNCCVVSQEIMLFDTSIRRNLSLNNSVSEEKMWAVLEQVGLKAEIEKLPNKLDFVFSRGEDLSGGQKQRLMIARAVLKQADVYILDEATSALDEDIENEIMQQLLDSGSFNTAIIISHRYNAIKNCDKIAVLDNGGIEIFGQASTVIKNSAMYNRLFPLVNGNV